MRTSRLLLFIGTPLVLALTAYAVGGLLFPTPSDMPRIPSGPGTFGNAIMKVIGVSNSEDLRNPTGTVQNTERLGGTEASRYVRLGTGCTDPLKPVWVGVDDTGTPICGRKSPGSLVLAKISEKGGNITIYQSSGTIVPGAIGMSLSAGDVVVTDASGTGTIEFSDDSIIRLSTNTTVELSPPAGHGTIAEVILASGDLWGRILTTTGSYGIGDGSIVAAVRGTSIALSKGGTATTPTYNEGSWKYSGSPNMPTLTVVDSQLGGDALRISCSNNTPLEINVATTDVTSFPTPTSLSLSAPESGNNIVTGCNSVSQKSVVELYTESAWIRENTRADIIYLSGLTSDKARRELTLTLPTPEEEDPICINYDGKQTNGVWYAPEKKCVFGYADYTEGSELHLAKTSETPNGTVVPEKKILEVRTGAWLRDDGRFINKGCYYRWGKSYVELGRNRDLLSNPLGDQGEITGLFNTNFPAKVFLEEFPPLGSIYPPPYGTMKIYVDTGVLDCIDNDGAGTKNDFFKYEKVTFYGSDESYTPTQGAGASITGTGYIEYKGEWITRLAGKRVRIKTNNPVTVTPNVKKYIAVIGTEAWYAGSCGTPGSGLCKKSANATTKVGEMTQEISILPGTSIYNTFKIGNHESGLGPIGESISRLVIE